MSDELADKITPPKQIWLQWFGDDGSVDCSGPNETDVTWSQNKVCEQDIEYVLAANAYPLIEKLTAACEEFLENYCDDDWYCPVRIRELIKRAKEATK